MTAKSWSKEGTDPTFIRRLMSRLARLVRSRQFELFNELITPLPKDTVLDVGVTPDTFFRENNYFDKQYPYKSQVCVASIEDCQDLVRKSGLKKFFLIRPGSRLPFKDNEFDIVTSWATLEHVGSREKQMFFLSELCRVGRKVFITTPDRWSPYEPHTSFLVAHWFGPQIFRKIAKFFGKTFWSKEENLNILSFRDVQLIAKEIKNLKIRKFKIMRLIPSHLILYRN